MVRALSWQPRPRVAPLKAQIMREIIRIVSSAGTGYAYYTTKNKRTKTDKLKLMKFDPIARKHVEFVEARMPNPKG
jgi:large subunit ribosomal protein L33